MTIPALAASILTSTEIRIPQSLKILNAVIHSSLLVQALCWSVVFFL
jgi:hypothetical protein